MTRIAEIVGYQNCGDPNFIGVSRDSELSYKVIPSPSGRRDLRNVGKFPARNPLKAHSRHSDFAIPFAEIARDSCTGSALNCGDNSIQVCRRWPLVGAAVRDRNPGAGTNLWGRGATGVRAFPRPGHGLVRTHPAMIPASPVMPARGEGRRPEPAPRSTWTPSAGTNLRGREPRAHGFTSGPNSRDATGHDLPHQYKQGRISPCSSRARPDGPIPDSGSPEYRDGLPRRPTRRDPSSSGGERSFCGRPAHIRHTPRTDGRWARSGRYCCPGSCGEPGLDRARCGTQRNTGHSAKAQHRQPPSEQMPASSRPGRSGRPGKTKGRTCSTEHR